MKKNKICGVSLPLDIDAQSLQDKFSSFSLIEKHDLSRDGFLDEFKKFCFRRDSNRQAY